MTTSIERLAGKFHGRICEKEGSLIVFFNDPNLALDCAHGIELCTERKVDLCGCELTVDGEQLLDRLRQAGL